MAEIEESLLKKKIDSYSSEMKDFQSENELTVEITLNEYRELIKEKAIKNYEIEKANKDKYAREDENKKLKQNNKELENKLFEYRKTYGDFDVKTKETEETEDIFED